MGESENQESDFVRVITALFKDDIETAVKNVIKNRIKPTIQKTASDSLKDLIDQIFHTGPSTPSIPAASASSGQKTAYNRMFNINNSSTIKTVDSSYTLPAAGNNSATTTNFNGLPNYVTVATYNDAMNIVNYMNDVIREEGEVSVNAMFDSAGKSNLLSGNSVATKYGWDNIDAYQITETPDGQHMLLMPRYKYLRKDN